MGGLGVTELSLLAQGVTFDRLQPFGPEDGADLREALRGELQRRTELTVAALAKVPARRMAPVLIIGPVKGLRSGECISCGDPMLGHRSGQCTLCIIALQRALVAAGRIAV